MLGLAELASILGDSAQLPARVEEALGQLAVVGGVIAVEQGLVAALDDEASDVHCQMSFWLLQRLAAIAVFLIRRETGGRRVRLRSGQAVLQPDWRGWRGSLFFSQRTRRGSQIRGMVLT